MNKRSFPLLLLFIIIPLLVGCSQDTNTPQPAAAAPQTSVPQPDSQQPATATQTEPAAPTLTPTAVLFGDSQPDPTATATEPPPATQPADEARLTATPLVEITPTPDIRPPPEKWQVWPVVPTLSPWLVDVYEQGQALGNNDHAFSRVGDCQNIPNAFLGIYDRPGHYYFTDKYSYLQTTVDHFSGSFARDNISVSGGFNFPAIFSPLMADPAVCEPNETPLACEIRLHKPIFIIISLEFDYKNRTPENYGEYLRQAVDYTLSQGVIPILTTKADNVEGGHRINLVTAQIAYEYDLPLWNFWRAVQYLPDAGLDPERPDGFHISPAAWNERSFTALMTLDALWQDLEQLTED